MSESEGRARRVNVSSILAGCLAVLALSGSRQQLIRLNPRLPEPGRVRLKITYESIYGETWTELATF